MNRAHDDGEPRAAIAAAIHDLGHRLSGQAAIRDFVHHNTLHGYQSLPFAEALAQARRVQGCEPWMADSVCRDLHRAGRIDDADIDAALAALLPAWGMAGDERPCGDDGPRLVEVLRAGLLFPLEGVTLPRLLWLIEEEGALERLAASVPPLARARLARDGGDAIAVSGLWAACLEMLQLEHAFEHPEACLERARLEAGDVPRAGRAGDAAARAAELWRGLRAKVGAVDTALTLARLLRALSGEDVAARGRALLIRMLGNHLDLGVAAWHSPARNEGFYAAWRAVAAADAGWAFDGVPGIAAEVQRLPSDPLDVVLAELAWRGLGPDAAADYLRALALELPGWSAMMLWREEHPGHADTSEVPVSLADYCAVRLVLERLCATELSRRLWSVTPTLAELDTVFAARPAELLVRHALHGGEEALPEWLRERLRTAADAGDWAAAEQQLEVWRAAPDAESRAGHELGDAVWPLFQLAQHLGLDAAVLRGFGRSGAEALLGALRGLDADRRGYLWLGAYERNYRERIFAALAANHGRWRGHGESGPSAQLVFCMDDREEGMRRHLEEVAPAVETLGGAAHFGVFQNYVGLDDRQPTPLCPVVPVVIKPAHEVREVPRREAAEYAERHRARRGRRVAGADFLQQATRSRPLAALALIALAAPLALSDSLLRAFAPGGLGRLRQRLAAQVDIPVATELALTAASDAPPATPEAPRPGFTDAEQADRVAAFLAALGLVDGFAPLVVILGHGSNSVNNPHLAAYDCGACAGRHSGANARLFAAMANRPAVRGLLRERGIVIPERTHFLGAEHNTADDLVTWYDLEDLPSALRPGFERLDADLVRAGRAHAVERCRRLASAPLGISPEAALAHVGARRHDWSQARPELGHATNACAFFGRRALSRGAFFDRRSFLISYDPTRDPDGAVLERHLLANGAVGAGISLEYFFSTADSEGLGCGSKVTHNIAGYFGVMQGACGDLATGLPRQMTEVHEAMRLLVVVEQSREVIAAIYHRQPALRELVGGRWLVLAAKDPATPAIHLFDPETGWQPWQAGPAVARCAASRDWFAGKREALAPALLERPLATA